MTQRIGTNRIANTAITANNIGIGAITSNLIANGAITNAKLSEPNAFEDDLLTSGFAATKLTNRRYTAQISGGGASGGGYDANTTSTGVFVLPQGTTGQRPASAANGSLRFNTTLSRFEGYLPVGGWTNILSDSYTVEFLIIAGAVAAVVLLGVVVVLVVIFRLYKENHLEVELRQCLLLQYLAELDIL